MKTNKPSGSGPTIRNLTKTDLDGLVELWTEFARRREGLTKPKLLSEDAQEYFMGYARNLLDRRDTLALVAEDEGRLVAYLIATKQRKPPIYNHTQVAYLSDTFVVDGYRNRGILKRFMEELLRWSERQGVTAIDVQLFESNKEALEIYRHLGFHDYRILMRREVPPKGKA